jgi:hypothetical protein
MSKCLVRLAKEDGDPLLGRKTSLELKVLHIGLDVHAAAGKKKKKKKKNLYTLSLGSGKTSALYTRSSSC